MKEFGIIYKLLNKINNKVYIGQTIRTLNERIGEHRRDFKNNKSANQYLLNAFNKYGWDNFEFTVIDTAQTIEELNEKEIFHIYHHKSNNSVFGYNIEPGGRNSKPTPETLLKMSIAHSGIVQNKDWVEKRIYKAGSEEAKKYGKEKTEEEKTYLSKNSPKYWLNKTRDEETKRKISETKLKQGFSELQKEINNKKVYKLNSSTNKLISIFESTIEAGKFENVHQSTISRWCSKDKIINNIQWTYNEHIFNKKT